MITARLQETREIDGHLYHTLGVSTREVGEAVLAKVAENGGPTLRFQEWTSEYVIGIGPKGGLYAIPLYTWPNHRGGKRVIIRGVITPHKRGGRVGWFPNGQASRGRQVVHYAEGAVTVNIELPEGLTPSDTVTCYIGWENEHGA